MRRRSCWRDIHETPPSSRHLTSPLTVVRELRRCRLAWRLPPTRSHGGSQGFKSPHLHPQHCRSERRPLPRGGAHCMLRPRCGRRLTSQCSREGALRDEATRPRPHTLTTQRSRRQLPTDGDPLRIQPLPVDHAVEAATAQHRPRQRPKSNPTLRRPSTACASLGRQGLTSGRRRRSWTRRATTPPAIPARACLPDCPLHDLIPVGHSGRWKAQTPDTGHLDAQTRAPDTDLDQLDSHPWDTGRSHRTLTRTGRRQHNRRPDLLGPPGRPTARWTSSRVPALARPGGCWVAWSIEPSPWGLSAATRR
jgi:hypothetical protein